MPARTLETSVSGTLPTPPPAAECESPLWALLTNPIHGETNPRDSILGCAIYYAFWIYIIPKLRKYHIRQVVINLDDGAQSHEIVKVPNAEIGHWDATHDAVGRELGTVSPVHSSDKEVTETKV